MAQYFIQITNNKPNKNRKADATFRLHSDGSEKHFMEIVEVYSGRLGFDMSQVTFPGYNSPVTYGKYTYEIIEEKTSRERARDFVQKWRG